MPNTIERLFLAHGQPNSDKPVSPAREGNPERHNGSDQTGAITANGYRDRNSPMRHSHAEGHWPSFPAGASDNEAEEVTLDDIFRLIDSASKPELEAMLRVLTS
jgi:hypothetical protein